MKYFKKNDSIIIADQEFLISDFLENIAASVIYHLFSNGHEQLTKAELKESQGIASVRMY